MELDPGTGCFATQLGICAIRDLVIIVTAPQLNRHAYIGESVLTDRESQARCRDDRRLNSRVGQKSISHLWRFGIEQRRPGITERIANELRGLGAMFCNDTQAGRGLQTTRHKELIG